MASSGGKGHIPWTRLQHAQSDYISDEYLPAGITLTQYHHIRARDVNALLQHWTARQAAGETPFHFKKVVDTSQKCNGDSIRGDSLGGGEDTDGAQSGQAQVGDAELQGDGEGSAAPPAESGPSPVSDVVIQGDSGH